MLTHLDELESPVDAIAIWQGGLQFSGGFVFAVIAGYPVYRHWNRLTRWHSLDGYAYGLAIGLGIGRIGCYAVGEHFGSLTSFPLAVRYDGGPVREELPRLRPARAGDGVPPDRPLRADVHGRALRAPLLSCSTCRKPRPGPGVAMAIFCGFYGVARFASDSLRVNDETLLGLTGAQYLCLAMLPTSAWIWFRVRKQLAQDIADGMPVGIAAAERRAGQHAAEAEAGAR